MGSFKYVQCHYCGHTKDIINYPIEEHKLLKKTGYGICRKCTREVCSGGTMLTVVGRPFIDYILEQRNEQ